MDKKELEDLKDQELFELQNSISEVIKQRNLEKGRKFILKLNTQEVECEVQEFKKAIDASTLETLSNQDYIA